MSVPIFVGIEQEVSKALTFRAGMMYTLWGMMERVMYDTDGDKDTDDEGNVMPTAANTTNLFYGLGFTWKIGQFKLDLDLANWNDYNINYGAATTFGNGTSLENLALTGGITYEF